MNSTMLMPKCSSTIVLRPILARERRSRISGNDALTTNSTWSYGRRRQHQRAGGGASRID